ncbi:MAG: ferredoxin [Clostridia bacterium]|nr:ferredoxin [Clostridia bacterium]
MKVIIDIDTCIGCGSCVMCEPKVFKMVEEAGEDHAIVIAQPTDAMIPNVEEALSNCPVSAISMD